MNSENKKPYTEETTADGEKLLCIRVRRNSEWKTEKVALAELVISEITRNPKFAAYFKRLLEK